MTEATISQVFPILWALADEPENLELCYVDLYLLCLKCRLIFSHSFQHPRDQFHCFAHHVYNTNNLKRLTLGNLVRLIPRWPLQRVAFEFKLGVQCDLKWKSHSNQSLGVPMLALTERQCYLLYINDILRTLTHL